MSCLSNIIKIFSKAKSIEEIDRICKAQKIDYYKYRLLYTPPSLNYKYIIYSFTFGIKVIELYIFKEIDKSNTYNETDKIIDELLAKCSNIKEDDFLGFFYWEKIVFSNNSDYCHIKDMSDVELYDIYNRLEKDELINMLIECNKQFELISLQPIIYE